MGAHALTQVILPLTLVGRAIHHLGLSFSMELVLRIIVALVVVDFTLDLLIDRRRVEVTSLSLHLSICQGIVKVLLAWLDGQSFQTRHIDTLLLVPGIVESSNCCRGGGQSLRRVRTISLHYLVLLRGRSCRNILLGVVLHLARDHGGYLAH